MKMTIEQIAKKFGQDIEPIDVDTALRSRSFVNMGTKRAPDLSPSELARLKHYSLIAMVDRYARQRIDAAKTSRKAPTARECMALMREAGLPKIYATPNWSRPIGDPAQSRKRDAAFDCLLAGRSL
jgi:hypothetical protein